MPESEQGCVPCEAECSSGRKFNNWANGGEARLARERKQARVPGNAHSFPIPAERSDSTQCVDLPLRLLLLDGFDVRVDVRDALLDLGFVTLAHVGGRAGPTLAYPCCRARPGRLRRGGRWRHAWPGTCRCFSPQVVRFVGGDFKAVAQVRCRWHWRRGKRHNNWCTFPGRKRHWCLYGTCLMVFAGGGAAAAPVSHGRRRKSDRHSSIQ